MSTEIILSLEGVQNNSYGNAVVAPGQPISGVVTFHPQTQRDIKSITITLQGLCKTEGSVGDSTSVTNHREDVLLVRRTLPLFTGMYTIKATKLDFPFDFVMPRESGYTCWNTENSRYFFDGPQPLPPSLRIKNTRPSSVIEYSLIVNVNAVRASQSLTRIIILNLRPLSASPLPNPRPYHHSLPQCIWSSRRLRGEQHTLKQKFVHALGADPNLRTPRIAFDAFVACPVKASRAQPLPISMTAKQIITGSTDPELPELVLDQVCLKLEAITDARVGWLNCETAGSHTEVIDRITIPMRGRKLAVNGDSTPIVSTMSINDIVGERIDVVPTFKSYTVSRRYVLAFKAQIRHPDTDHVFRIKVRFNFELLPEEAGTMNPRGKTTRQSAPLLSTSSQPTWMSTSPILPAYETLEATNDELPAYTAVSN